MLLKLKGLAQDLPEPFARPLVMIPYAWRLGRRYAKARRDIARFPTLGEAEQEAFIFARVRRAVGQVLAKNEFYRWFYGKHNFSIDRLREFKDIQEVPVVNKSDLQAWKLERRSVPVPGRFRVNTGGTSGQPLEFYATREVFANEWAHMHHVWRRVGYRQTDLKLTFRGKDLGARTVRFNPVHNELVVNAYHPQELVAGELLKALERRRVRYLHGYPSTLYEIASYCLSAAPALLDQLRGSLRGVLLGSECPLPAYREVIERAFPVPSISWYGHSEMGVLAYEAKRPLEYVPLQTYGHAEAVTQPDGSRRLVATTYFNRASPFIRYDTGDEITPLNDGKILGAFRMASGRAGDFVVDRHGQRVSLTALIFGRHHEAFGSAEFVQIRQSEPGRATILVVPATGKVLAADEWARLFDFRNVELTVDYEVRERPVRTPAGKTPLLVRNS